MTNPSKAVRDAERRVIRAAMRWYASSRRVYGSKPGSEQVVIRQLDDAAFSVVRACAALARQSGEVLRQANLGQEYQDELTRTRAALKEALSLLSRFDVNKDWLAAFHKEFFND